MNHFIKEGFVEVTSGICPICGKELPGPSDTALFFTEQEPWASSTGAFAKKVCHETWLVWRAKDQTWHWEIKANITQQYRGKHGSIISPRDVLPVGTGQVRQDRQPGTRDDLDVQDVALPRELGTKRRLPDKLTLPE